MHPIEARELSAEIRRLICDIRAAGSPQHKPCKRCGQILGLDQFARHSETLDGRQGICKSCDRQKLRDRRAAVGYKKPASIRVPPEKRCAKCKAIKPAAEFYRSNRAACGLNSECKACNNQKAMAYAKANPERRSTINKRFREKHRDRINTKARAAYSVEAARAKRADLLARDPTYRQREYLKNRERYLAQATKRVADLSDGYVACLLDMPAAEVPPALMEAKRLHVAINRELRRR